MWHVGSARCVRRLSLAVGWVAGLAACPGGGLLAAGADGASTLLRPADLAPQPSEVLVGDRPGAPRTPARPSCHA